MTTREVSSLFWLAVFFCWMIWKDKDGRLKAASRNLFRCFLTPWISVIFSLAILWIVSVVLFLAYFSLWSTENLKLTFYWAMGIAIVSLFESRAARKNFSGLSMVRDHLGAIAVIQIFVSIKSLPLVAELVIVPVSSILILIAAFSEDKLEYKSAKKASEFGLMFFGLLLLSWSLLAMYSNPKDYLIDLSTNILLPVILTLGFLPFLIIFYLFLGYEHTFRAIAGLDGLGRLDKLRLSLKAFFCVGLNLERISLLERQMRLHRPKSRSDLVKVIDNLTYTLNIQSSIETELSQKADSMGWGVQNSRKWLLQFNLFPQYYEWLGFAWQAHDSVESSTQDPKTTLTYYIAGNQRRATELELLLDVFGVQANSYLSSQFNDAAVKLVEMASREALDKPTKSRINKREPFSIDLDQCTVEFSYTEFPSLSGVEAKLLIKAGRKTVRNLAAEASKRIV